MNLLKDYNMYEAFDAVGHQKGPACGKFVELYFINNLLMFMRYIIREWNGVKWRYLNSNHS